MDENASGALSRRQVMGWVGMGAAVAAARPGLAQESSGQSSVQGEREPTMQDPRTKYPKPPFKEQTQPWPGLASKMDPRPDHGEKAIAARAGSRAARR